MRLGESDCIRMRLLNKPYKNISEYKLSIERYELEEYVEGVGWY
jgi:hypothetical protein